MKRCKRCYSIIEKGTSHCPSCGLEANLKNTYYTSENKNTIYNKPNANDKKKNGVGVVIFFIIFYAVMFIIGVFASVEEEKEYNNTENKLDISAIANYLHETKLMTEDYYKIWTYALNNSVTKEIIVDKTALTMDNLTNNYCKMLELNPTINNSIKCVKNAYIENGTYDLAYSNLNSIYSLLLDSNLNNMQFEIVSEIYMYSLNLYSTLSEETDYDKFENDYNFAVMKLEFLIEELENESL